MSRIVIVGLGGIGSWALQALAPFCQNRPDAPRHFVLVDGDEYEEKNKARQLFTELGPKAVVQAGWLARNYSALTAEPVTEYISADGADGSVLVAEVIKSGDLVLSCVDNHKTRKVIAEHCARLRDVTLISGGNDYTDGNVQVFIRRAGKDRTVRPEKHHPELAQPRDKSPHEMSCEELAESAPQLIFANMTAATLMVSMLYAHLEGKLDWSKPEVYFDVLTGAAMPRTRK